MTTEELKEIILLIQEQDKLARKLDDALADLNSSHTVLELDRHTRKALYILLSKEIDVDVLDNWLYLKDRRSLDEIVDCLLVMAYIDKLKSAIDQTTQRMEQDILGVVLMMIGTL